MRTCRIFLCALMLVFCGTIRVSHAEDAPQSKEAAASPKQEKKKEPVKEKASSEKKPTRKLEPKEIKIEVELDGVVEAIHETPFAMDLDRWADLTVVSVLPHGTAVKKGDELVEFETDKLTKKVEELERKVPIDELELQMAQRSLEKLEKTTPLTLENARRSKQQAEEDLAYFEDVTKPMRERDAKEDLKTTADYLAYAEEELAQLKKMYEKDDLTEETEEIILKRAQNSVDSYKWMLEQTKTRTERMVNTDLPRQHEQLKSDLELRHLNWRAGEQAARDSLEKARLDFEAKKRIFEESKEALEEYRSDLSAMKVVAPHDGIVYYGMSRLGKWTTASTVERKLIPGGKLTMREIFLTLVDPGDVRLRVSIPEAKLKDLKDGQPVEVALVWDDKTKIAGKLGSISYVPYADNTYDAIVQFSEKAKFPKIFPGMKAKAAVTVHDRKDAILVPKAAVHGEGDKKHVLLAGGKKQPVELGFEKGSDVEVVKGLKAGDVIELPEPKKPEEKKPEEKKPEEEAKKEKK